MCNICEKSSFDLRFVSGEIPGYILNDIKRCTIRPGIQVNIRRHAAHAGLSEIWEAHSRTFIMDFLVSGDFSCQISGNQNTVDKTSGLSSICYIPGQTHHTVYQSDRRVLWLKILVDLPVMQELVLDGANRISMQFRKLLETGGTKTPLCISSQTSPSMLAVLNEIFNCPYRGALGRLFIESKVLELLTMRLVTHFIEPVSRSEISGSDKDRIYHARHILEESLDNAPTMSGLARQVGMSETKLKRGFKQVFGKPVFNFLKGRRLDTARKMLLSGEWNVTEASMEVGYSSISHFSHIFQKEFGVSPSRLRKNVR